MKNNKNIVFNLMNSFLPLLISSITYPYLLRVLQVENMGAVAYSQSIVNYFVLVAGLGISTYAIRTGTEKRGNRQQISRFASQMIVIADIVAVIVGIIYYIIVINCDMFANYREIMILMGVSIFIPCISREWIFSIFEDFKFLTLVSLGFQLIQLIFYFVFVRNVHDIYIYITINSVIAILMGVTKFFKAKKYCDFVFTKVCVQHIRPIFVIFANTVAVNIYVNSDITMLGIFCNDYMVGIYSVAVTLFTMLKSISAAVINAEIPRIALVANKADDNEFINKIDELFQKNLVLKMPALVGLYCISEDAILLIGGNMYIEAANVLRILCIADIFATIACILANGIFMLKRREKKVLNVTIVSATVNILLNLVLIPQYKYIATAYTTLISECIAAILLFVAGKKYIKLVKTKKSLVIVIFGVLEIIFICCLCGQISNYWIRLVSSICLSILCYFLTIKIGLEKRMISE